MPDPRTRPNRLYPWPLLWGLISAAMASACQTPAAIARSLKEHRDDLLAVLPPSVVRLPCESTIRRTLKCVDARVLDAVLTRLPTPPPPPPLEQAPADAPTALVGLAIDGKSVRGVGRTGHPCQLVSLVEHASATVLAQEQVAHKRDERSAVPSVPWQACAMPCWRLFRRAGWRSVPSALAHYGASVRRALTLVGLIVNTGKSPGLCRLA